jgi:hypothetical protein
MKTVNTRQETQQKKETDSEFERELKALLVENDENVERECLQGGNPAQHSPLKNTTSQSISNSDQWWIEAEVKASLSAPNTLPTSSSESAISQLVTRLRSLHGHDKSLHSLLHLLQSYAQRLEANVVQVIGQQYPAFLLLHRRQAHLLSLIHLLRPSLTRLHDEVHSVLTELTRQLTVFTQLVQRHSELTHKRRLCERFLTLAELVEHGDVLLERVRSRVKTLTSTKSTEGEKVEYNNDPNDKDEELSDSTLSTALLLERVATHLLTTKHFLIPCRELPFALKIDSVLSLSLSRTTHKHTLSLCPRCCEVLLVV